MRRMIGTWINTGERKSKRTWIWRHSELRICHYNMAKVKVALGDSEVRTLEHFSPLLSMPILAMQQSTTMVRVRCTVAKDSIHWRKLKFFICLQDQSSSSLPQSASPSPAFAGGEARCTTTVPPFRCWISAT